MATLEQKDILKNYSSKGIIKGGELLLPKELIISFMEELSNSGVQINGCDIWRYADSTRNPARIVEFVGGGVLVHYANPRADTLQEYATIVKDYILLKMPTGADFVSLVFEDSEIPQFLRKLSFV